MNSMEKQMEEEPSCSSQLYFPPSPSKNFPGQRRVNSPSLPIYIICRQEMQPTEPEAGLNFNVSFVTKRYWSAVSDGQFLAWAKAQ